MPRATPSPSSEPEVPYDPLRWRDPAECDEGSLSPMLRQYYELKRAHAGCLLLMRVGDFYEAYGEDAVTVSAAIEIVLTKKDAGEVGKIPMAGVPFFAVDNYLRGLVSKGFRVAVADQVEDPKLAKGVVKRDVTRVVTSGTVLDPQMLDERRNNFIMAVVWQPDSLGLAVADITTGEFSCTQLDGDAVARADDEVLRWRPAELLHHGPLPNAPGACDDLPTVALAAPDPEEAERMLKEYYEVPSLLGFGILQRPQAMRACALLMRYVLETQKQHEVSLSLPRLYSTDDCMVIDQTTRRNLELVETMVGRERRGSLLWALDACVTSMGARMLRSWIERPLLSRERIELRHDAVAELVSRLATNDELRALLSRLLDMPRLLSRAIYGTANARDLLALTQSIALLPDIARAGQTLASGRLRALLDGLEPLDELRERLTRAVSPDCPASVREGNMICPGYHDELDELRELRQNGRRNIAQMEETLRAQTGIKSLKIGFNQVFGYYIEVTKSNLSAVPAGFIRKQTIANGERYINEELKQYEEKVLGADERIKSLEYSIFCELLVEVVAQQDPIRRNAERLAELDVLCGFAQTAAHYDYVRPHFCDDNRVAVEGGRHPVVERVLGAPFVPNDVYVDGDDERLLIITGPNMAGKSTYLRQVALLAVMAQAGSFVPARSATLSLVDRVFTRVGASDDLHLGQSTFLVEMSETANILNHATAQSLVVLDEIGRGTSTFDGLSIAWAVAEYLHDKVGCKTLFATHFHELTELEKTLRGARAYRVAVKENRDDVVFLHRILPGRSDRSYGIYVAKLAGVPPAVLGRANEVLAELEQNHVRAAPLPAASGSSPRNGHSKARNGHARNGAEQLTLFATTDHPVLQDIRDTRLLEITPLAAMNLIHEWQRRLADS
jgi:DNA mismatch repair protein MutS